MKVELTKGQCESLVEFIELNFFDAIRNDPEVDSIEWARNILNAHQAFKEAAKS